MSHVYATAHRNVVTYVEVKSADLFQFRDKESWLQSLKVLHTTPGELMRERVPLRRLPLQQGPALVWGGRGSCSSPWMPYQPSRVSLRGRGNPNGKGNIILPPVLARFLPTNAHASEPVAEQGAFLILESCNSMSPVPPSRECTFRPR